jgi:cytochrome c oxidase subunit 2
VARRERITLAVGALVVLALAVAPPGAQDRSALVAQGRELFAAQGCYGCHTIGAAGTPIAPDLSHVGSRYRESDLARWLANPAAQEPTRHMPPLQMSPADAAALAAYLVSLR